MQSTLLKRVFKYNGLTLADPDASMAPGQVAAFYAAQYPELATAVVEGPVTKGDTATYSFTRAAGAKGNATAPSSEASPAVSQQVLQALLDTQVRHFALASIVNGLRKQAMTLDADMLRATLLSPTVAELIGP